MAPRFQGLQSALSYRLKFNIRLKKSIHLHCQTSGALELQLARQRCRGQLLTYWICLNGLRCFNLAIFLLNLLFLRFTSLNITCIFVILFSLPIQLLVKSLRRLIRVQAKTLVSISSNLCTTSSSNFYLNLFLLIQQVNPLPPYLFRIVTGSI